MGKKSGLLATGDIFTKNYGYFCKNGVFWNGKQFIFGREIMKIKILCGMCASFILLTGCGGNEKPNESSVSTSVETESQTSTGEEVSTSEEESETGTSEEAIDISMDEIAWTVVESNLDGQPIVSFEYTNNTPYVIADVEMEFTQRADVTEEQRNAAFSNLIAERGWTAEEAADVYILGYNRKVADPGETVSSSPCVINGTYTYVESMEQYQLMEPSTATIACLGNDDKVHIIYYDFKSDSYSESTSGAHDAFVWSDSELASLLPKPDAKIVQTSRDTETNFSFIAYGITREMFDGYLNQLRENGMDDPEYTGGNRFEVMLNDYGVTVYYDSVEEDMSCSIEAL